MLALLSVAMNVFGCRTDSQTAADDRAGGAAAPPRPAPPAEQPLGRLLGRTHAPVFALLEVNPDAPSAFADLASALTASDLVKTKNAALIAQLSKVAADAKAPVELVRLAGMLSAERRCGLASLWLDYAALLDPGSADTLAELGDALLGFDRPSLAIQAYDKAVSLDPNATFVWERLARACLAEGRARRGRTTGPSLRDVLEKVKQLDTREDVRNWADTALVRLSMAEGTYAGPPWNAPGPDGKPKGIGPLRLRTNVPFEKGLIERDATKREELFAESLREDPGLAPAALDLALALQEEGKHADAVPYFEEARKRGAQSPDVSVTDAMAGEALSLVKLGRAAEAEALASAAAKADATSAYARYVRALIAWEGDDVKGAAERCLEALALQPEHPAALTLLGDCYARDRQANLAQRAYEYAFWAEPSSEKRAEITGKIRDLGAAAP